jgi:hypothetical protein
MYPTLFTTPGVKDFAEAVDAERQRQIAKFGDQHHPDGTWMHVLIEEVFEALAEEDPAKLRAELVQVAAVCAAWITDIDGRGSQP